MTTKASELERKWLGKLTRLNPASGRGQCRGKAPHKPLLLLCLLDMAEAGELQGRTFTRTAGLVLRFKTYGALVADRWPTRLDLRMPFFYLRTQGFWQAFTLEMAPAQSPESCFVCELHEEFFELMAGADFRLKARLLLVSRYFEAGERVALLESLGLCANPSSWQTSHARHCIEVLNHGKHVCTAVPAFRGDIEDAEKLLACVRKNRGLVYAMFETSVFHDDLYAMEKLYKADVFGRIVYAEGEYCHPHSLGAPSLDSYKDWSKKGCPMWYPTHATAYYAGVTHGSFLQVSCQGMALFDKTKRQPNAIGNIFNSEVGLFRTREGGLCRIIICGSQGEYLEAGRLRGEYAGYDWHNGRGDGFVGDAAGKQRLQQALANGVQTRKYALPPGVAAGGHGGSHGYLADDFIDAILRGRRPAVDVIDALNMTVPGYYAHLSSIKDGETLKIPQYSL